MQTVSEAAAYTLHLSTKHNALFSNRKAGTGKTTTY
jgi:hypothetical protein